MLMYRWIAIKSHALYTLIYDRRLQIWLLDDRGIWGYKGWGVAPIIYPLISTN